MFEDLENNKPDQEYVSTTKNMTVDLARKPDTFPQSMLHTVTSVWRIDCEDLSVQSLCVLTNVSWDTQTATDDSMYHGAEMSLIKSNQKSFFFLPSTIKQDVLSHAIYYGNFQQISRVFQDAKQNSIVYRGWTIGIAKVKPGTNHSIASLSLTVKIMSVFNTKLLK